MCRTLLNNVCLTGTVGHQVEDRGPADGFAVGHGAPAVPGLVVALHWQEVAVRAALGHEGGRHRADAAGAVEGGGLQGLSPGQLALGLTRV